jgi:hypothetical protein
LSAGQTKVPSEPVEAGFAQFERHTLCRHKFKNLNACDAVPAARAMSRDHGRNFRHARFT